MHLVSILASESEKVILDSCWLIHTVHTILFRTYIYIYIYIYKEIKRKNTDTQDINTHYGTRKIQWRHFSQFLGSNLPFPSFHPLPLPSSLPLPLSPPSRLPLDPYSLPFPLLLLPLPLFDRTRGLRSAVRSPAGLGGAWPQNDFWCSEIPNLCILCITRWIFLSSFCNKITILADK